MWMILKPRNYIKQSGTSILGHPYFYVFTFVQYQQLLLEDSRMFKKKILWIFKFYPISPSKWFLMSVIFVNHFLLKLLDNTTVQDYCYLKSLKPPLANFYLIWKMQDIGFSLGNAIYIFQYCIYVLRQKKYRSS